MAKTTNIDLDLLSNSSGGIYNSNLEMIDTEVGSVKTKVANLESHFPETGKFVSGTGSANGNHATALGHNTIARDDSSYAEGEETKAYSAYAHAEGYRSKAGEETHAESWTYDEATGQMIKVVTDNGKYAHAEGMSSTASGRASHAEGDHTTASGDTSHAEGNQTTASGLYSHAEGSAARATNNSAHAEGMQTIASGYYSHVEGLWTRANHKSQHVFGEYNIEDGSSAAASERGNYVEIVGNGTRSAARSNARTLDWSGNEKLAGGLTLGMGTADEVTITPAQLKALLALLS